jgi:hypothetical protein
MGNPNPISGAAFGRERRGRELKILHKVFLWEERSFM